MLRSVLGPLGILPLLLLGVPACVPPPAPPQDPALQAPAASPLDPASAEAAEAEYLLQQDHLVFAADGTSTHVYRRAVKLKTSAAAEQYGFLEIAWSPWLEARPEVSVTVEAPDGRRFELDPTTVSEAPQRDLGDGIYSDRRVLRVPVPGTRPGAVVRSEVRRRSTPSVITGAEGWTFYYTSELPQSGTELVVEYPVGASVRAEVSGEGITRVEERDGDTVRLSFIGGPRPAWEPGAEELMPMELLLPPFVRVSTGASWADLAERYAGLVDERLAGAALEALAREAAPASLGPDAQVEALLALVHERVRYVALEYGESSIVPHTPAETLSRGYGDCKDQATLLVGLLRAIGRPAEVALIRPAPGIDVSPGLPSLDVFSHAIVFLPGATPRWIDPTHRFASAAELPDRDRGRQVLVAARGTTGLVPTPPREARLNRSAEVREVNLADAGYGWVVERTTATGDIGEGMRASWFEKDTQDAIESLAGYAEETYMAPEIHEARLGEPLDLDTPFTLELTAREIGRAWTADFDAWFNLREVALFHQQPLLSDLMTLHRDTPRTQPVDAGLPHEVEIIHRIRPPAGFEPYELPAPYDLPFGPGHLRRTLTWKDGVLEVVSSLSTGRDHYSAEEANEIIDSIKAWEQVDHRAVHFRHRARTQLDAGQAKAALAELEALVHQAPPEAAPLHRARLALALMEVGLAEAAQAQVAIAAAAAPEQWAVQRIRGRLAMHDAIGRFAEVGYDREEALTSYRQVVELRPDDLDALVDLARALSTPRPGQLPQSADLEEATPLWAACLSHEAADDELRAEAARRLAETWLLRGDPLQAAAAVRSSLDGEAEAHALAMLQVGAGDAAEAARILGAAGVQGADRTEALAAISGELVMLRLYPEARAALDRALSTATPEQARQLTTRAQLLADVRRLEEVEVDPAAPESLLPRFLKALAGEDPAAIHALADPSQLGSDSEATFWAKVRERLEEAPSPGMTRVMGYELVLANYTVRVEGDGRVGYRIHAASPSSEWPDFLFYGVVHDGAVTLRAFSKWPHHLAEEAEARLARGDVAGARTWIEWAVREQSGAGTAPETFAPLLWRSGYRDSAEGLAVIAAALRVGKTDDAASVARLAQAAETATGDPTRLALLTGAAWGQLRLGHAAEALAAAERITSISGDADRAYPIRRQALAALGREEELMALVEGRILDRPGEVGDLEWLAAHLAAAGRLAEARSVVARALDRAPNNAVLTNEYAWLGVRMGQPSAADLRALERVCPAETCATESLHTIATLQAELGMTSEALVSLHASIARRRTAEPKTFDWYVIGRIGEQLGRPDAARQAYTRALVAGPDADSSARLAEGRLAQLPPAP